MLALLTEIDEWVTFAELCDLMGVDPRSGKGRAVEGMLTRMRRRRDVDRREITADERYDRGVAPTTAWMWRAAQNDTRGRGRVRAAAGDVVDRRAKALRDLA